MSLRLDDKWVWDFWFATDGDDYHIFYLQADKSLGDPELRHWNVSVGHAVSQDLSNWKILPDALIPSAEKSAPDSYTTWTGSILRRKGTQKDTWCMFYTGTSRADDGLVQRVCLATSKDLIHWQKHDANPVAELNEKWYDGLNLEHWHDASWRDPWVMKDPDKELYHMLVTCRSKDGAPDGRGAIGYARSENLVDWTVEKPFLNPGWYGEMEVPQIAKINGAYYLFCSISAKYHSQYRQKTMSNKPCTGVQYFVAPDLNCSFATIEDGMLISDHVGAFYSGKVIEGKDRNWYLMTFKNYDENGVFVGEIGDPLRIEVHDSGRLTLADAS